jgi:hypothetical protein
MLRRCLSILLALVCAVGLAAATTAHAPAAHAAPLCYSTYQEVKANSGWHYDYTLDGDIKDEALVVAVFDTATGSLCRAYGEFKVDVEQYLNQCSYTAYWDFMNGSTYSAGNFRTSACWTIYTAYSGSLKQVVGDCFIMSGFTNEGEDQGADVHWCP